VDAIRTFPMLPGPPTRRPPTASVRTHWTTRRGAAPPRPDMGPDLEGVGPEQRAGVGRSGTSSRLHRARALLRRHLDARIGATLRETFHCVGARCDRIVAAIMRRRPARRTADARTASSARALGVERDRRRLRARGHQPGAQLVGQCHDGCHWRSLWAVHGLRPGNRRALRARPRHWHWGDTPGRHRPPVDDDGLRMGRAGDLWRFGKPRAGHELASGRRPHPPRGEQQVAPELHCGDADHQDAPDREGLDVGQQSALSVEAQRPDGAACLPRPRQPIRLAERSYVPPKWRGYSPPGAGTW